MQEEFTAKTVSIKTLFKNEMSFYIPLYQRNYSWQKEEVNELLNDLKEFIEIDLYKNINNKKAYYMGNLLLKYDSNHNEKILIDGQQRITTFLLFLKALKDIVEEKFSDLDWFDTFIAAIDEMIFVEDKNNQKRIKLSNINGDNKLKKILNNNREKLENEIKLDREMIIKKGKLENSLFYKNYNFIYQFLSNEIETENNLQYWFDHLLKKIAFVSIYITSEEDEHLVFENINSKGKALSIIDLIKNYLYIYAEKIFDLNDIKKEKIRILFDDKILKNMSKKESEKFIRAIIAYYTGKNIKENDTKNSYNLFKKEILPLSEISEKNINDFIDLLEKAFETYKYIKTFNKIEVIDDEYSFVMHIMNTLFSTTLFILILRNALINIDFVKENDAFNLIVNENFKNVIFAIEEYWLKIKLIHDNDSLFTSKVPKILKNYNGDSLTRDEFFLGILNAKIDFGKELSNQKLYVLPSDFDIKQVIISKNIGSKELIEKILLRINFREELRMNSQFDKKKLKLEYIMPKNIVLMQCWKDVIGYNWEELHAELVDKLGNFTLVQNNKSIISNCYSLNGSNGEISKREFYSKSNVILTRELSRIEIFNEKEILKRTEELADKFISLFK